MPSLKGLTKRLKTIENNKTVIPKRVRSRLLEVVVYERVWNCEDLTGKCMVFWISDAYGR